MIIFVSNIGKDASVPALKKFIESAIVSWIPFSSGQVKNVKIHTLIDLKTKLKEYHGLIELDDKYGKIAIKKLNRKRFMDRYVNVREYKTRSFFNDRRNPINDSKICDRYEERRRGDNVEVITDHTSFSAVERAHRKY